MKRRFALSVVVLLVAAGLRLWQIAELPPGLHPDEAFHLLNAQQIAHGQNFPLYITGNNGNEPLFAYSAALVLLILGPVTWAGRLAAAWYGLVGVAATIRLGDEMFPGTGVGWLAGAALGALLWNVDFSRFGSQPIVVATAAAATMAALWRGARTGSPWAFALAGAALGLGLDAYVAFRLFPLVPLAAGLALLVANPNRRRALVVGGTVAGASALLVYSPLALFFVQHPEWFFNRFNQVTSDTLGASKGTNSNLLANGLRTLGGLVLSGDQNWRHNVAGRPALDGVQDVFAAAGVAVVTRRQWWPQVLALGLWLVVGLIPSVVTTEAPHFGRTIMTTPALAMLLGLGVWAAWRWAQRWPIARVAIVAAGLFSVGLTAYEYFGVWAHSPAVAVAFEADRLSLVYDFEQLPAGATPYTAQTADLPVDPWVWQYMLGDKAFATTRTDKSRNCLLLPTPAAEPAVYTVANPDRSPLLPELQQAYPAATWSLSGWLQGEAFVGRLAIPAGQWPLAPVAVTRSADFGGVVRMLGYTMTPSAPRPGGILTLHILWQTELATTTPYKTFVHLLGTPKADGSPIYAQHDSQPCDDTYATTGWAPGDWLAADTQLDLPADLPAGVYTLQTGWYDTATGARAPITADAGPHANEAAQLEQISINP